MDPHAFEPITDHSAQRRFKSNTPIVSQALSVNTIRDGQGQKHFIHS